MADFDLTQTDAQVQSILNDAQDAQGAGAQTTLTTEYIMLKDTSGNYHKILKSSFTEACRNVLAGLLVNNDKGTTISQIAAIASGDFGSVTPANLASVLGATLYIKNYSAGTIYTAENNQRYIVIEHGAAYSPFFFITWELAQNVSVGHIRTSMSGTISVAMKKLIGTTDAKFYYSDKKLVIDASAVSNQVFINIYTNSSAPITSSVVSTYDTSGMTLVTPT